LEVPPEIASAAVRYRSVITMMQDFFADLRANKTKDTPFQDEELRQRLRATGFVR
ncbi:MAG: hypothetical protein HY873_08365, partial [Chloroflexi bacterium]|nr:hypothetical protein [Chloroflexota bacterium]